MTAPPEVSVVVPCYDEAGNIRPLIAAIRAALDPLRVNYEIVVTDDASRDGTWEELQKLGRVEPRLCAQRFAHNCGQSAALWAGIRAARGDVIVTLDSDLQNPPSDIPKLLAALERCDCVCGTRVAARAKGDNWVRIASSHIANWVRNKLSGETISDAGCCFRAFKRECVANIKFYKGMHRFLPTLIKMEGFTVAEVPVSHQPRHSGQTHYGIWNRLFKSSADLLAVRWMKKRVIRYAIAETVEGGKPQ
jgi:glycosyltransferase involved in cell wall biosynthesis